MRSHAKASTAGSTQRQAAGFGRYFLGALAIRRAFESVDGSGVPSGLVARGASQCRTTLGLVCFVVLSLAGLAFSAAPSPGAVITDRLPLFSFDGADTTAGPFSQVRGIAVDNSSGSIYVLNEGAGGVVDKLNASGEATNFSASGKSSLDGSATPQGVLNVTPGGIAVDGSSVNPGRLYLSGSAGQLNAFSPTGEYLWQFAPGTFAKPCGLAVDTEGHLWVSDRNAVEVREFAATGSPPAEIGSFTPQAGPCGLGLNTAGDVYLMQANGNGRFDVDKYVGGVFGSTLDPDNPFNPIGGIAIDQSSASGHIFVGHSESFNEYESSGTLIGAMGANALSEANGIDYNPALDRVYVAQFSAGVKVFGPRLTGTVPDPAIEATSEVSVFKAKFHGKVNPQSVPNKYFFEWKVGAETSWGAAKVDRSSPQSLPEDSSEHAVELLTNRLRGNTTYQVRLVVENSANGLRSWSGVDTFTTTEAAAAPAVTINPPSPVGTTTATVSGTINPQGDTAGWRVQLSTDLTCATGFTNQAEQSLPEGGEAPVNVSYNLTSLLPSQHYCVRISATNSFGATTSETKEFETDPVIADQVEIAPAAPRLDTSARLNARVNPHGDELTYRFEYSEDGGVTWIPLSLEEDTSEAREQIVIGSELGGLNPSTSYRYRLALLEDGAGQASSLGGEETFTTRTTAEATPPDIGIELVNNPEKGTQNALAFGPYSQTSPISPDGDKALWTVFSGAPGSNSGTQATFLAERSADGWHSRSLVPSADKQVGGGGLTYTLETSTPDLAHFVSQAAKSDVLSHLPQTVVHLDANANQDILTTYTQEGIGGTGLNADMTSDGTHVVAINKDTRQLEDIGSGTPELISVMPDGTPAGCLLKAFEGGEGDKPTAATKNWRPGYHRIAQTDASRAYFQVSPNGECGKPEGLYERNRDSEETTLIDPGLEGQSPELIRSAPDGREAYFVTKSKLDSVDTNHDKDVYRWDEEEEASTCLTCAVSADAKVSDPKLGGANVEKVVVSDDFSHVYFASPEQLVPGRGQKDHPNIYAMSGGQVHFVTEGAGLLADPTRSLLSADGNVLTFKAAARESLTSDDVGQCLDLQAEPQFIGGCTELYRYDDRDSSIECLSCLKGGLTTSNIETPYQATSPVEFQTSADGSTTAFTTQQRLLPKDVNNDTDIYEWRDGSLRLITDGVSDFQEYIAAPQVTGIDEDGENVLFSVVEPGLTGYEHDGLANVYDARIGGGFERPTAPIHCEGDSCQGLLVAPPPPQQPGSSSFSGHGNAKEQAKPRCRKGKVRRKGRCVARHPHKRRHQRASHTDQGRTK